MTVVTFPPTVVPLAQLRLKKPYGKLSTAQVASRLSNTTMFMRSRYHHDVTVDLKFYIIMSGSHVT